MELIAAVSQQTHRADEPVDVLLEVEGVTAMSQAVEGL
jgi:hypothetical protein